MCIRDRPGSGRGWRRVLEPPAGDVHASGEPHAGKPLDVLEEVDEGARAGRRAGDAAVQADRHHAGHALRLGVEAVEGGAHVLREVTDADEAPAPEPRIVDLEGVGHDEPRPVLYAHVVGKVVVQAQAVVELSLIHIPEPTRLLSIPYAVVALK